MRRPRLAQPGKLRRGGEDLHGVAVRDRAAVVGRARLCGERRLSVAYETYARASGPVRVRVQAVAASGSYKTFVPWVNERRRWRGLGLLDTGAPPWPLLGRRSLADGACGAGDHAVSSEGTTNRSTDCGLHENVRRAHHECTVR